MVSQLRFVLPKYLDLFVQAGIRYSIRPSNLNSFLEVFGTEFFDLISGVGPQIPAPCSSSSGDCNVTSFFQIQKFLKFVHTTMVQTSQVHTLDVEQGAGIRQSTPSNVNKKTIKNECSN